MKLINADKLMKNLGMCRECRACEHDPRNDCCHAVYSRMDICKMLSEAEGVEAEVSFLAPDYECESELLTDEQLESREKTSEFLRSLYDPVLLGEKKGANDVSAFGSTDLFEKYRNELNVLIKRFLKSGSVITVHEVPKERPKNRYGVPRQTQEGDKT